MIGYKYWLKLNKLLNARSQLQNNKVILTILSYEFISSSRILAYSNLSWN